MAAAGSMGPRERIANQHKIPITLKAAAQKKYAAALPVAAARTGKALALTKEPRLPTIFMAPETLPAFLPAMSAQKTQLGLTVMSEPNTAKVKHAAAAIGVPAWVSARSPAVEMLKPRMGGILRDHTRYRER